jgi:iron complex transport system ATP-binding protein
MILDVQQLRFGYNGTPILDSVDLTVAPGELLAILGPNGVGKTTLLKCLNAIHRPRDGAILVEGRDLLHLDPARIAASVGYVAQKSETARMTVFDAVLLGRKPHIRWRPNQQDLALVDAALHRLELAGMRLRHLDTLSGGELQKICIARALVQEPRLLLLDEPTSALDLKNQVEIMRLLRRVVDEHRIGAVMTMHDLNKALRYADSILMLKDGAVYSHAPAREITPDMIETVYGLPVEIHRFKGYPYVVPVQ